LIEIFHGKIQLGGQIKDFGIILNQKWILEEYIFGCKMVGSGKYGDVGSKKSLTKKLTKVLKLLAYILGVKSSNPARKPSILT
jgi:hypothetical protein